MELFNDFNGIVSRNWRFCLFFLAFFFSFSGVFLHFVWRSFFVEAAVPLRTPSQKEDERRWGCKKRRPPQVGFPATAHS
ncbi:MAG: hypothetical protein IKH22_11240 [Prevotella sp.]|nr:hypothetical protein [Prevotella sp.]